MQLDWQWLNAQVMSALPSDDGLFDRHCWTHCWLEQLNTQLMAFWHAGLLWQATHSLQQLFERQSPQGSPVVPQLADAPQLPPGKQTSGSQQGGVDGSQAAALGRHDGPCWQKPPRHWRPSAVQQSDDWEQGCPWVKHAWLPE